LCVPSAGSISVNGRLFENYFLNGPTKGKVQENPGFWGLEKPGWIIPGGDLLEGYLFLDFPRALWIIPDSQGRAKAKTISLFPFWENSREFPG